jgi:hypothetical protein
MRESEPLQRYGIPGQGKRDEPEPVLKRAVELAAEAARISHHGGIEVCVARGQRDKIPKTLRSRPRYVIDGDYAYRTGGIQALPGEREQALPWLRRGVEVGNHKYAWFQKDKNDDGLRGNPEYGVSWKEFGSTRKQ